MLRVCMCAKHCAHLGQQLLQGFVRFFYFLFFPPFFLSLVTHTHTHMALAPAITGAAAPPLSLSHDKTSFILIHSVDLILQTLKKSLCCLFYQHFNHVAVVCNPGTVPNL